MTTSHSTDRETITRALTVGLAAVLIVSLVGVVALAAAPPTTTEPTTEFALLDGNRSAADYPTELAPGETGEVWVEIGNHEHQPIAYDVAVAWNGTVTQTFGTTLVAGAAGQRPTRLVAPSDPGLYRVTVSLSGNASVESMETRLYVDVGEEN
ncbi:DUF1616 domain-containing protein [Halococcoides cellulosivorans]|uniref:DUF1616 domain-containing protein n=1 Tax=Halococcoides cellulosivorans TaxID=1679096 RepID=UPI00131EFE07|nr:DUF1616 domain-containing protein [Halococcoides cellulosivorans]